MVAAGAVRGRFWCLKCNSFSHDCKVLSLMCVSKMPTLSFEWLLFFSRRWAAQLLAWAKTDLSEDAQLIEQHGNSLRYRLSGDRASGDGAAGATMAVGAMFGAMERHKAGLNVLEYSLGQTTLEQIFIDFAKTQQNDADAKGVF